ncbi:MAG: zf-HC2 domain-containing protein [Clostridia bacterium]|jgi:hypothetical protein|nr:zf-HC2 domain-containing protein [Clostridia bacterium]MDH7574078.1 zf-HC2 domain-containing protein [Clostridia bacterium]
MICFDEGRLLAYLDGQLSPRESREVGAHLAACPRCREVLAGLAAAREQVGRLLSPYHLAALNLPVPQPPAWPKSPRADAPKTGKGVVSWMRRHYQWIAAAAVVALFFGYAPARSLASQFLSIFRVERVQLLHFDPADVAELNEALRAAGDLSVDNFGRVQTRSLPAGPELGEGQLPGALGGYTLQKTGTDSGTLVMITPDVEGINAFLAGLGSGVLMPAELDGRTFKLTMPPALYACYRDEKTGKELNLSRSPAPTLEVPPGVDMAAVRQALLALPILPRDLKRALEGIEDWTRTLPVPDFGGRAEEIALDGAPGIFVPGRERPADRKTSGEMPEGEYYGPTIMLWYRHGIWTVLAGDSELSKEEAFALARQLEAAYGR